MSDAVTQSADKAGAEDLKQLLDGPTAFTYVAGDPAVAAKAIATFRRQSGLLEFKGGTMAGEFLTAEQLDAIARLPARDALNAQFVGVLASPITGLVRGLGSLISGLAIQLGQIQEQGLVGGAAEEPAEPAPADEAPGDAVAEAETAEQEQELEQEEETETSEAPSEGGDTESEEG